MGFASYDELKVAVQRLVVRTGDLVFEADFPRQVEFAEQRINFGCQAPLASPPVRVRGMEKTVVLEVVAGVAVMPDDYLEGRRLTWKSDVAFPLQYRTPEEFWNLRLNGCGLPAIYTVEGNVLTMAPEATGEATLTYYAKFQAIETEDTVTDRLGSAVFMRDGTDITQRTTAQSNWLMENAPAVVMSAVLIESWKFLRNNERAQEAYAEFLSAVGGLNVTEIKARTTLTTLAPRIKGAWIR